MLGHHVDLRDKRSVLSWYDLPYITRLCVVRPSSYYSCICLRLRLVTVFTIRSLCSVLIWTFVSYFHQTTSFSPKVSFINWVVFCTDLTVLIFDLTVLIFVAFLYDFLDVTLMIRKSSFVLVWPFRCSLGDVRSVFLFFMWTHSYKTLCDLFHLTFVKSVIYPGVHLVR